VGAWERAPVVAEALDPNAVAQGLASAEPEVIVHQLTAPSRPRSVRDARRPDRSSAATMTNRLRTEAADRLSTGGTGEADRTWALVCDFNESGTSTGSSTCRLASTRWMFSCDNFRASRAPEWLAGR
jgi:hypothetical protein